MKRRALLLALATVALLPTASCSEGNADVKPEADAGPDVTPSIDAGDAAAEDSGPSPCAGDWCIVPLDGLRDVSLNAVWGSGPNDVWVVGTRGFVAHFDGSKWEPRRIDTLLSIFSIWGSGPNDIWAGNSGKSLYHWKGSSWEETRIADGEARPILAISGSGSDNVFVLLEQSYEHGIECPVSWGTTTMWCPSVFRLSRASGDLAWQEASSAESFCPPLSVTENGFYCRTLGGLWVGPDGEPWMVGEDGRALRPRPGNVPPAISPGMDETHSLVTLEAVGGTSTSDVWAIGASGTIRHYTGQRDWTAIESPTNAHLRAIWAGSPTEAWAVGNEGAIIHWDGQSWKLSETPVPQRDLYGVWGVPGGDTWAVGERVIVRRQSKGAAQ